MDGFVNIKEEALWKREEDRIPLHARLYKSKKKTDHLVVYLHGAVNSLKYPYYNGMGIAGELKNYANFLLISDPLNSLYEGPLRCSWYTSPHEGEQIIETMAKIVKSAVKTSGATRVLFISGSAGGIPLMRLGKHVDNAFFFIWNPQTNIFNYSKGHINRWCKALQVDDSFRDTLEKSNVPTSVNMNFKSHFENKSNHYFILQMLADDHHVREHMTPFYEALSGKKANFSLDSSEFALSNVLIHIGAWSPMTKTSSGRPTGHVPPRRKLQVQFIKDFIGSSNPKKDFGKKYFKKWNR